MLKTQSEERLRIKKLIIGGVVTIIVSLGSFYAGIFVAAKNNLFDDGSAMAYLPSVTKQEQINLKAPTKEFDQDLFWQVWGLLQKQYVDHDELDQKKMFYGAVRGLVASTGDPYTVFFDPEENKEFKTDVSGQFEGIGAEIGLKDDLITVVSPLDGSPAEKAGLLAGDKIIEVNGTSTIGLTVNEAVKKIRGPKKTQVVLTVLRDKVKNPFKVTIERNVIVIKSVKKTIKDGVTIIKVNSFNENTDTEFNQAVAEVVAAKTTGIILDLRNNPGGYLNVAISMTGKWIGNQTAVIEKFSQGRELIHKSSGLASLKNIKTVVLVNEGSASASEILAGALQDYKLGVLVGKKTFGKGSVQTLEELPDGSSVKITSAIWITPNGRSINKEGIKPDVEVAPTEADIKALRDVQLIKAMEVLKNFNQYLK